MRTIEPTQITTREEVQWTRSYADHPASLWQLNYYFRGPGVGFNAAWATEITADGDTFVINVPASKTDDVTVAGVYHWQAWLTEIADTTNKINIGSGRTKVTLGFDPSSTNPVETRSQNQIILDSVNAAMLAFADEDVLEYTISTPAGSRTVKRSDKSRLLEMRKTYATLVANEKMRERIAAGKPAMTQIKMRVFDK